MKKVIRLTENDLERIVKRVIKEQQVKQSFSKWLESKKNIRGTGSMIDVIKDCLKRNGYSNPDMAPEKFKELCIMTEAFGYGAKMNPKVINLLNSLDSKSKKIISCLKHQDYQKFFENGPLYKIYTYLVGKLS